MVAKPATKRAPLKDFSELRPIEKRIELLATGIYHIAFRGEKNESFRPKRGTQLDRIWNMEKMDERQQIAWVTFCDHVNLAYGKSGSVGSSYGEYTDRGGSDQFRVPVAYANSHHRQLERLGLFLSRKERALLSELLQDSLKGNSSLQIETIGLLRSSYTDKVSARAAGVAHCQCLMDRLADFFGI